MYRFWRHTLSLPVKLESLHDYNKNLTTLFSDSNRRWRFRHRYPFPDFLTSQNNQSITTGNQALSDCANKSIAETEEGRGVNKVKTTGTKKGEMMDTEDVKVEESVVKGCSSVVQVTATEVCSEDGTSGTVEEKIRIISEGKVKIPQSVKIFYNPTQEFNRDISILAIQTFINTNEKKDVKVMEAMSASGIRAIRYAKEIEGISKVIANDYSSSAVETIRTNAEKNQVDHIVEPSFADACAKMYEQRGTAAIVDLDPYGTPTPFLDAAVQCVQDGGLLMVTATDMASLAGGNHADACFAKYGAMSIKSKACHEIALRIVIHCIQSTANRNGRVVIPLLSLSVDFYVRLFFKVIKSPKLAKQSVLKTSVIYQCTGCKSFTLQPLASIKGNHTTFAQGPPVPRKCENCDSSHHIAGPIWSGPLHNHEFLDSMTMQLNQTYSYLGTFARIKGMLGLAKEELLDYPLFYNVSELCSIVKSESIPLNKMRSAIMNLGYQVSLSHVGPNTIKTNMPNNILWDILRAWRLQTNPKPIKEDCVGHRIMSRESTIKTIDFTIRADATPLSQHMNLLRYQTNPERFWGPGCRDSFKSHGDGGPTKRELNQGKYKKKVKKPHLDTSEKEAI